MTYVEFLRVRNAFYIYAGIVAAVMLVIVISIRSAHVGHGSGDIPSGMRASDALAHATTSIPWGFLLGIAGYFAVAFATVLASSLNRENERAGFVFTKPVSRARLALSYFAVDAAAIVAAFAYALLVFCIVPLASVGLLRALVVDAHSLAIGFLGLGTALMWYGILQALTAGYRGRGGKFVGFSWLVFVGLTGLASVTLFGPLFHGIVMLLNVFNPFAYFGGLTSHPQSGEVVVRSLFKLSTEASAAITWCLAAAGCTVAIAAWKRVEV